VRPDVLRAAVLGLNARRPRLVPDLDVPGRSRRNVWSLFEYGPTAPAPSETPGELPGWKPDPFAPPSDGHQAIDTALTTLTRPGAAGLTARQDQLGAGPHQSGGAGVDFSGAGMPPW